MSEDKLRQLLSELRAEVENTEGVDDDLRESLKRLEADVEDLIDPETDSTENNVMDDAIALETSFAAHFPVAEKILREVINTLNRIGI